MTFYPFHATVKRSPTEDKHVELADITIDEDPNALDDFLNSEDVAVVTEPTLPPRECYLQPFKIRFLSLKDIIV